MSNLTAIIGADTSKFVNEVKSAQDMLKKFVSATEDASNTTDKNISATNEQVNAYKRVVKQLEKVASGNMSSTQQTKALEAQVRELKIQWANLSDEAKRSDFGKAISASMKSASSQLDTLKQQINQASDATKGSTEKAVAFDGSLNGLIGMAKKLAPAIGGVVAVQKVFTDVVNGSQASSDLFNATISTGKNVLKELATAVSTFDFSAFAAGLDSIIKKGYDAAAAIDQLGNTIMSYNIKSAKANQKLTAAKAILSDPKATKEEKEKAKKDMADALTELKSAAGVMMSDYENALITEVNSRGGNLNGEGALAILDKWLEVDTTENRQQIKDAAKAGYEAYTAELKNLQGRYTTSMTMQSTAGAYTVSNLNRTPEYDKELSELNDKYKDQIAYHVLLEKYSDEELENLGKQRIAMININGQLDAYSKQMNNLNNKSNNGGGSSTSNPIAADGSVSGIKKAISETQSLKDAEVVGTEEWWAQVRALEALNEQLYEATSKEKRLTGNDKLEAVSNPIVAQVTSPKLKLAGKSPFETQMQQLDDWKTHYKKTMEEVAGYSDILGSVGSIFNALGSNMDENGQAWMNFAGTVTQSVAKILPQLMSLVIGNQAAAMAEGTASSASLPFPANLVAIASVIAELLAVFAAIPKFASGGIVGGGTGIGDYNIARVNSGEMIMNGSQQKRLFNLLDGSDSMTSPAASANQVEFKIRGTELIGCINNIRSKMNKI